MINSPDHKKAITTSPFTSRDSHLWLKLWRNKKQESFHQKEVNSLLTRFWPDLGLLPGSRVFVPLCGKSQDMVWLAQQGHDVVGVELSPVAAEAFFCENKFSPIKQKMGEFTLWRHDRITILCGDYFALKKEMLGDIDVVYDRAALTALPEDLRMLYVQKLQQVVPKRAGVFLLTVEDDDTNELAQQDSPVDKELISLYSEGFDIKQVHVDRLLERNHELPGRPMKQVEYKVYKLSSRS